MAGRRAVRPVVGRSRAADARASGRTILAVCRDRTAPYRASRGSRARAPARRLARLGAVVRARLAGCPATRPRSFAGRRAGTQRSFASPQTWMPFRCAGFVLVGSSEQAPE